MRSNSTRGKSVRPRCNRRPTLRPLSTPAHALLSAASKAGSPGARDLGLESLEGRTHFSVSHDVNGFTVVTPTAGVSRLVYVSNSGSDSNNGLSPATPVKSISVGRALLRNNSPDFLLFRRGDTFSGMLNNWTLSGVNADQPMVIGAYTDPAHPSTARPIIDSGISSGFTNQASGSNHPALHDVDILGVSFVDGARDYRNPPAGFTTGFNVDAVGGSYGVNVLGSFTNLLVEDCQFQYYRSGMSIQGFSTWGNPTNVTIRRSQILDSYAPNYTSTGSKITSEGIYANEVMGLTLQENIFDHNGWTDAAYSNLGANASIFNHNAYLNIDNENVVVTGNIFSNASSHGLQARAGGIITNNLFYNNPIAMSYGYTNAPEKPGGVHGEISGNVIYGSRDISGALRGWGLEICNTRSIANGGGTVVKNNIYEAYGQNGQPAIQVTIGSNTTNPDTAVGVNDLTITQNIVYGWTKGITVNAALKDGGTGRTGIHNLQVIGNDFQLSGQTPVVEHPGPVIAPFETWANNRYNALASDISGTGYFRYNNLITTLASWKSQVEPTAQDALVGYPNASASPGTYDAMLGGTGTPDDLIAQARQESSTFWRPQYLAKVITTYVSAGFSGQHIISTAPTAALTAAPLNAGGAPTYTFSVIYTDGNAIDPNTIDSSGVVVTGPNGYNQTAALISVTPSVDGTSAAAIYSIPAPNGVAWDASGNGSYSISVVANKIKNTAGLAVAAGPIGTAVVNIAATNPTATIAPTTVTGTNTPATLIVTYKAPANGAISVATLDSNDLLITGPDGNTTTATFVSVDNPTDGNVRVATYQFGPPDGGWTNANNGTYTVATQAGEVMTVANAGIGAGTIGTFKVNVSVASAVGKAPDITSASSNNEVVTVTYTDAKGINLSTIGADDLTVNGPAGTLSATVLSSSGQGTQASPLVVKYSVAAPAGTGWDSGVNGVYTVSINDGAVTNLDGNAVPGTQITSFQVNIDVYPPSAVATAPAIYHTTGAAETISVAYTDATGVDTKTLGTGDIVVYEPDSTPIVPTFSGFTGSGTSVTATYTFPAPTGGWKVGNNGTYNVEIEDGQVADTLGNAVTVTGIGQFVVAIDTAPPVATASLSDITDPQATEYIGVNYVDDVSGTSVATLSSANIQITGPNGYSALANYVPDDSAVDSTNLYANYTFSPPTAYGWTTANNGTYTVTLLPSQVSDAAGNFIPKTTLGTFNINVTQAPPPRRPPSSRQPRRGPSLRGSTTWRSPSTNR